MSSHQDPLSLFSISIGRDLSRHFQKLICNLLLNIHPICTARFMHPILTHSIYNFYLNYETICIENGITNNNLKNIKTITDVLLYATEYNNIVIIKWSLKNGANVHSYGDRALRYASRTGYLEIVKLLLDRGANIHAYNDMALQLAADNDHFEIVKLLIASGADVSTLYYCGTHHVGENSCLERIKRLLNAGIDICIRDDQASQLAARMGHADIIKFLQNYKK